VFTAKTRALKRRDNLTRLSDLSGERNWRRVLFVASFNHPYPRFAMIGRQPKAAADPN
jgi:hypothetical protein